MANKWFLPTFIMIGLGYFLKQIKLFDDHTLKSMNNITFKTFLPLLLFYNVYKTNIKEGFNPKLMIFATMSIIISFFISWIIISNLEKDKKKKGVLIQGIFRSNFVLFGMPISISLFGEGLAGVPSMLIAVIVPIFNFLSVIILEIYKGESINLKKILKGIITNPLICASIFGFFMTALGIKLPGVVDKTVCDIAKVATPLALIILGGSFEFKTISKSKKQLVGVIMGRLIIIPGIFIPISIILGFRNIELATLIVMFAAPTAISSFTMAQQMEADSELAGNIVVFSSIFAIFTMFFLIFIVKQVGFI
jgi:predicted permease